VILAREFWSAQGSQELRLERARLVAGGQFDVAFTLNGERQELSDYSAPAWVFFVLAE
jgi:hypothetical protein